MASTKVKRHTLPLHMNGMRGRMLRLPPTGKSREILLLYGHHSSIERMFGFAEVLNRFGAVTLPDLPGFGGMESFYKIGEKPTLDNYADYIASFVKLKYKRRRVTIVAMSFSVPLVIRMLQKYPELAKKVDILVSTVGFAHKDDFKFSFVSYWGLRVLGRVGSYRLPAFFIKNVLLRSYVIRASYLLVSDRHTKLKDTHKNEQKRRIDFEIGLWRLNDVRTRLSTINMMLRMDVCNAQVDVPMYHVAPDQDRYFDNAVVEQHMRIIFDKFEMIPTQMPNHAPTVIAGAREAAPYIPRRLQRLLAQA